MTAASGLPRRRVATVFATASTLVMVLSAFGSLPAGAAGHDENLTATLTLPDGDVTFPIQAGTVQLFDEDDVPFLIQVIDGCAVNDRYWIFAAGLTSAPVPLIVVDEISGRSHASVLPAFRPGQPIQPAFDPDGLEICQDVPEPPPGGGLPELSGVAIYTSASDACADREVPFSLQAASGSKRYDTFVGDGRPSTIILDAPFVAIDEVKSRDELHVLTESWTPGRIDGVVVTGDQGTLPRKARLRRAMRDLTPGRVKRVIEIARNELVPKAFLDSMRIRKPECVYHLTLDFDTPGASLYLAEAGWLLEGGEPLEEPTIVEPRFDVSVVALDGTRSPLPLVGPIAGSEADGSFWRHADDAFMAEVIDRCALTGSFWTLAATSTEDPFQLVVTDTLSGDSVTLQSTISEDGQVTVVDTSALGSCST